MKHQINYEDLKVGQKVWTIHEGYCTVNGLRSVSDFVIKAGVYFYTKEGFFSLQAHSPSLFLSNPFEAESQAQERVVEVRQYEDVNWHRRVLITEKRGKFVCWRDAQTIEEINTNHGGTSWNFMRELPIKTILTKTEIAEKFGVDVENLEIR
jgi:hypothetical protein